MMDFYRKNGEYLSHEYNDKKKVNNQQMLSLLSTTQKLINQNRGVYKSIIDQDPTFHYNLYKPKYQYGISFQVQKEARLRQIDKLLDEQEYLCKKKHQVFLRNSFKYQNQFANSLNKKDNLFSYRQLQQILNSLPPALSEPSQKRVQQLSNMVNKLKIRIDKQIICQKVEIRKNKYLSQAISVPLRLYQKIEYKLRQVSLQAKNLLETNKNLLKTNEQNQKLIQQKLKREQQLNRTIADLELKNMELKQNIKIISNQLEQKTRQIEQNHIFSYNFINSASNFCLKIFSDHCDNKNTLQTSRSISQVVEYLTDQTILAKKVQDQLSLNSCIREIGGDDSYVIKRVSSEKKLKNSLNLHNSNVKLHGTKWLQRLSQIYTAPINQQKNCMESNKEFFYENTMPENESQFEIRGVRKFKRSKKTSRHSNVTQCLSEYSLLKIGRNFQ